MIPRYTRKEMAAIFEPENRFKIWLEIEIHALDKMAQFGIVPKSAAKALCEKGDFDIKRIDELRPEVVKFDAHWITHLMQSGPGFALLQAMVKEFEGRGIITLFEGIEETWQLDLAEKCGASMVQGFVLARPEIAPTGFGRFSNHEQRRKAPAQPPHREEDAPQEAPIANFVAPGEEPAAPTRRAAPRRAFGQRNNRSL